DEIKKAYDYISKADLFFGRTNRSRHYGYWKYATDFMGIGVSNSKHETYKKFTKIQTPTIFTTMSRNRGKRNLRDKITEKMFEKMHVSSGVAVSMFPYLEIMFQDDELAWEISDFLGFFDEQDEKETEKLIKVFRKKKIPKKVITKMEKRKAQMRVEERDRRAEELKNQMMNVIVEEEPVEEPTTEPDTGGPGATLPEGKQTEKTDKFVKGFTLTWEDAQRMGMSKDQYLAMVEDRVLRSGLSDEEIVWLGEHYGLDFAKRVG
ncbi:MAG: hypothetical protein IJW45_06520, partial [Oscillospiraceae bacterium]|nr:hypothetical protein [Oscillospiraceae bacterium]